jgi:hypothetical protein
MFTVVVSLFVPVMGRSLHQDTTYIIRAINKINLPNTHLVYINMPHEKLTLPKGIEYITKGNRCGADT